MEHTTAGQAAEAIIWAHKEKGFTVDASQIAKGVLDELESLHVEEPVAHGDLVKWIEDRLSSKRGGFDSDFTEKDFERWLELDGSIEDASQQDLMHALPVATRHRVLEAKFRECLANLGYTVL